MASTFPIEGGSERKPLCGFWLGRRGYAEVLTLQEELSARRRSGAVGDTVLFLEHELVITQGRGAKAEHLLTPPRDLTREGFELASVGRGGDVTLHAPGQLVAYPIIDLAPDRKDVRAYVRLLSQVMSQVLASEGIGAGTLEAHIGVWVDTHSKQAWPGEKDAQDPRKIGAIGVKISRWITSHGFALNLSNNLDHYRHIVPCGIRTHGVTSVQELMGRAPSCFEAAELAYRAFGRLLSRQTSELSRAPAELTSFLGEPPGGLPT